jgi:potassium-transporting ATPase KdpC subunit
VKETLRPAAVALAVLTVLCGVVYPLVVNGIAAVAFPHRATGSLIRDRDGRVVGSELIGQPFVNPAYFWSRPTAAQSYDASNSTGTNFGTSNPALAKAAQDRITALRAADPASAAPVPIDLVTASSSGLDPHISPEAAHFQVARVARLRGQSEPVVDQLVEEYTEERTLGILGEPRVNVLLLNRALDAKFGPAPPHG